MPNGGSSSSTDTNASARSKSTAPTVVSNRTTPAKHRDHWTEYDDYEDDYHHDYNDYDDIDIEYDDDYDYGDENDRQDECESRTSVSTYASTTRSMAAAAAEAELAEEPLYEVVDRQEFFPTDALASTPSSFATLFPSSRRLLIRHDDTTLDGNMNLRVDTVVPRRAGYQQDVILFHLRMHDLFSRKFSLRRYCRDSGREICHSSRKEVSNSRRPMLRRKSWSTVLAGFRHASSAHTPSPLAELKRHDSGFSVGRSQNRPDSPADFDEEDGEKDRPLEDTITMEFSNYAHVELRRRGPGSSKRYEYEYWSTKYQWRRDTRKEGDLREVSYYLVDTRSSKTIAHLMPEILTPLEAVEEESKGGWVPPCSLWISDVSVYERMPDIAE
ncbi:hypothetical protein N7468_006702 [Penicillium chermesinum]|uniref:Uncharacterized protein n=1 Tax=Penicillium chermesinum TaxID=63820 RepID=A0A9W9NSR0_9EURO|nr:uncharacterized protein N7468_006702 [Penicillium chermesinum]KAJ5225477.1 hypothetical protein N7468_006702 [Penicillium chermesinum]